MDVYLVPVGPRRFELYCESDAEPAPERPEGTSGLWRRWYEKFTAILAAVEREQDGSRAVPRASAGPGGLASRLRARGLRWIAERIAEQRLLWRLRGQTKVRAFFPSHVDAASALEIIRETLERDSNRHLRWLAVDAVGGLFSLLLVPFPGPNLPGYYFTFRLVGHLLAIRGARQGLRAVSWDLQSSALLGELVRLDHLPQAARAQRVREVAAELGLPRLARFLERTTVETA
jgi:hypothetical protein